MPGDVLRGRSKKTHGTRGNVKPVTNPLTPQREVGALMTPATVTVVPCFNEAERLRPETFLTFAVEHPGVRFLFVDDGSTDATGKILAREVAHHPESLRLISLSKNVGKGEAVRLGLTSAITEGADVVAYWDADLATPLEELPAMVRCLEEDPAIQGVFASRVKLLGRSIERRAIRHYSGRVFATAASLILDLPVYDTQCGAKVFRVSDDLAAALERPFQARWIFDVELLARFSILWGEEIPSRIIEYPVQAWRDVAGSKVKPGDFLKAASDLLGVWRGKGAEYLRREGGR